VLGPADITEIAAGLWRWTAVHPEWVAGSRAGSLTDWPPEVGSVAYAAPDALVVIDPLVPDNAEALWRWLDERAAEAAGRVWAITTIGYHRRSRPAVAKRYGASTSRARDKLPGGVEPIRIVRGGETMFWLPRERTLVPGDRIVGADRTGRLRLCHESWLRLLPSGMDRRGLAKALRPLLDLPVERVLVSHGRPVLRDGRREIERAIEEAA
jgi:hypothetical protein